METPLDTTLDALASQARALPPLREDEVGDLLRRAHDEPRGAATEALVQHHLGLALEAALARRQGALEVGDLYQEGSIAVVTAIDEYAARAGSPGGLREYVGRVVELYVDAAVAREAALREADEALVRDSRLYETAEVAMRQQLGRSATTIELASVLEWSEQRVETVAAMLDTARSLYDREIIDYLDDDAELTEDGGAGS